MSEVFASLRGNISRNLSISAVKTALFLLLRIFAVSRWDWHVAGDVASTVDFGTAPIIVLGTLFAEPTLTGAAIMILLPMVGFDLFSVRSRESGLSITRLLSVSALAAVGISLIVTVGVWWLPIGSLAIVAAMSGLRVAWEQSFAHTILVALLRRVGLLTGIAVLLLATIVSTPWAPLEVIETTTGSVSGYVLETPSGFLKVLTDDERKLEVLISSDVLSRQVIAD